MTKLELTATAAAWATRRFAMAWAEVESSSNVFSASNCLAFRNEASLFKGPETKIINLLFLCFT